MSNLHEKSYGKLTLITVGVAAFISLVWSVGLIGKGIGQLFQGSEIQAVENGRNIPDFASVPNVATGVFNYGGSTAWASLRLVVDSVIQSERPEIQLRYVQPKQEAPGSSPGIQMLLADRLDFVQTAQPLDSEELELAKQQGLELQQVPVAVDSIAVAVHPQLNISGLTLKQLQDIYTGKITNWQELGGADLPITTYSRPRSTGGMVDFFTSKVLQGREFGPNVEFVTTTTQALRLLANNPGGIYYGSIPAIVPQCTVKPLSLGLQEDDLVAPYQKPLVSAAKCPQQRNQINTRVLRTAQYPLTYYLYVVFIQNEEKRSQIGRAYANFLLTPQGQKLIGKTGLIPLD
ncbi:ABC-type phosphate transport system, periplasmic component [Hyella patelloides LEGE 07179]|uniref:ABC-type phosphate transport system, periplasmic component n=1 Tax=Hyella patelloides LEGE 07179 TaxID=945734 RepID=A0A563VS23_9CYAN|nr:substrate-binding domain-containing protein [Hyella patelloides]VEP14258.1 ABC-type phosphate transport system, periplasmic component [Hyella patelloides LEGE 07179]